MGTFRNKMIDAMNLRRFSLRTHESYLGAITSLARYYNLPPDKIDAQQLQAYLLHLTVERGLSWSTCNVAVSAFRFFYVEVLGRERTDLPMPPRKKPTKLPEVLSRQELERLSACARPPRNRALLMTTYAAGLRVSEVISLKVSDCEAVRPHWAESKYNRDRGDVTTRGTSIISSTLAAGGAPCTVARDAEYLALGICAYFPVLQMSSMKTKVIYSVGGVISIVLIAGIWLLYSHIRGVTAEEVDNIFKSHIPIGAKRAEVSGFIDSLKIDSLRVENFGYRDDLTAMGTGPFTHKEEQLKGTMKGYLTARIHNTSRTLCLSQCDMVVRFYFDRDERLIDYEIIEEFD